MRDLPRSWPLIGRRMGVLWVVMAAVIACGQWGLAVAGPVKRSAASDVVSFSSCRGERRVRSGFAVPGWRMGAVRFLSAQLGVGMTAGEFTCFRQTSGGIDQTAITAPSRLAVTRDGGRSWYVRGQPLPGVQPKLGGGIQEIVASSLEDVWVLSSDGRVFESTDGGEIWRPELRLPHPVLQIAADGRDVLALSAPRSGRSSRAVLERSDQSGSGWSRLGLPRLLANSGARAQLTVASPGVLLINTIGLDQNSGRLYASIDDGRSWDRIAEPDWYGNRCSSEPSLVAAVNSRDWWILCVGGAGGGSSAKALLQTVNAGRSWHVTSAVRSLQAASRIDAIPRAEPDALIAGSPSRLWLSLQNNLSESADGGFRWHDVPAINPQGMTTTFDVLSSRIAWLLAPGGGLWRTRDGSAWHAISPLNTG